MLGNLDEKAVEKKTGGRSFFVTKAIKYRKSWQAEPVSELFL